MSRRSSLNAGRRGSKGSQITFEHDATAPGSKSASKKGSKSSVSSANKRATSTPKSSREKLDIQNISAIPPPEKDTTPKHYRPQPYTFRIPAPQYIKEVKRGTAKCPPYHLQLDHTLAVVWTLFSHEEAVKPLGIAQLQWALSFLKGIYNRKGEHPKDVALCIQAIQDELIDLYAELVDEVQYIKKTKNKRTRKSTPEGSSASLDKTAGCNDQTCKSKPADLDRTESEAMITKQIPFSVNYAEMIAKTPPDIETLYAGKRRPSATLKRSFSGLVDPDLSRENIVEFLKMWRRDQVEKIQAELKQLRSIEDYIGNVGLDNFEPYLDDKQLDDLIAQKAKCKPKKTDSKTKQPKKSDSKIRKSDSKLKPDETEQ